MAKIIPAIMPKDWMDLEDKISEVGNEAKKIQIDIMDGLFVKGMTWPFIENSHFEELSEEKETMPFWEDMEYELDMMVRDPQNIVSKWISAGMSKIIYHLESTSDMQKAIDDFNSLYRVLDNPASVKLFIAVPFDSKPDEISSFVEKIDGVQIMGISPVGVQGSGFKTETLQTVKLYRQKYPNIKIAVDGGVKEENIEDLVKAGADFLAVGSEILNKDDRSGEYRYLSRIASSV